MSILFIPPVKFLPSRFKYFPQHLSTNNFNLGNQKTYCNFIAKFSGNISADSVGQQEVTCEPVIPKQENGTGHLVHVKLW